MHEKTVEEIISRYPDDVWPGAGMRLLGRQLPLNCGRLDLLMQDARGVIWVVELKRGPFPPGDLPVLARYVEEMQGRYAQPVRGLAVGTAFSATTLREAAALGLFTNTFDPLELQALADRKGLVLADASPRPHRKQALASVPRGPATRRAAPDAGKVRALAQLDASYPPASLRAGTSEGTLLAYWKAACPAAPSQSQSVAARLTAEVLRRAPNAAVGNRAVGGWTTVLAGNGQVLAALDARKGWVKFDLLLPTADAQRLHSRGMLALDAPRRNGYWCRTRVGVGITLEQALQLVDISVRFEYPAVVTAVGP